MAHEALIRGWQRLRGWVDRTGNSCARASASPPKRGCGRTKATPDRLLPPGRPLAEGEDLLATRRADLEPLLVEYIEASAARRATEEEALR